MRIYTAPEDAYATEDEISVFLAGGISGCKVWQNRVCDLLFDTNGMDDRLSNLVVYNPRREIINVNDGTEIFKQTEWEYNHLEVCDIFSMYFVNSDSVQPICMYELGRNLVRFQNRFTDWQKRIIITVEEGYSRTNDVIYQTRLATGLSSLVRIGNEDYHTMRITDSFISVKLDS